MGKIEKIYELFEDFLSGIFLISGLTLIFYEVIMRYIFNSPSTWIAEISSVMVTWGILFGLAVALRDKHHISVDLMYMILPKSFQRKIDYLANLLGVLFCGIYSWGGIALVIHTMETGQKSMDTGISLWIYYLAIPISGVLFAVRFIENIYSIWKNRKSEGVTNQSTVEGEETNEYSNAF